MGPENVGSLAVVRHRKWIVQGVTSAQATGEATLVDLACAEDDAQGEPLSVFWEHEPGARLVDEEAWSRIGSHGFDAPERFAAYLHTLRWNSVTATDPRLFQAPFRAGIRLDAYQLEPLRKALELPRVNLFIADDVGLGKTIEAGLIARELLLRRRIDTIVVAAPPSTQPQWQDEMEARFGLSFTLMDRMNIAAMRRERGFGVNPWTTGCRFAISHALLIDSAYTAGLQDWLGGFPRRGPCVSAGTPAIRAASPSSRSSSRSSSWSISRLRASDERPNCIPRRRASCTLYCSISSRAPVSSALAVANSASRSASWPRDAASSSVLSRIDHKFSGARSC
ncbi:hypothetical protein [Zavarzinia sp. CC-PAN008]|uniref:hypothetical protein n=1 Tax=Zavarzinia sp. CC-PAN008 TaxID=3243332 RepID=UPI003F746E24